MPPPDSPASAWSAYQRTPESAKIQGRLPVIQDAGETHLQEINLVSSKIEIQKFSLRRVGETVQLSEISVYTSFSEDAQSGPGADPLSPDSPEAARRKAYPSDSLQPGAPLPVPRFHGILNIQEMALHRADLCGQSAVRHQSLQSITSLSFFRKSDWQAADGFPDTPVPDLPETLPRSFS